MREWQGDVIFLHEVVPGAADRSYGIQVARLAGLPQAVIDRASEVLHLLEESERSDAHQRIVDDLPLFSVAPQRSVQKTAPAPPGAAEVLDRVRAILPDELTPREALDLLYDLKTLAASRSNG